MKSRGFTLIELMVIITIIGILSAIAALNLNSWQKKSTVERYVKELYADVQGARMNAIYNKIRQGVEFAPQQVTFKSFSSESDAAGRVVSTKSLPIAIALNWTSANSNRIEFNTSGIMSDPIIKVICFTNPEDAPYDAVIITPVLTNMGKVTNRGAACARTNVTQK
ncbi:MAG: prepilin-type N-terminal cleavage/methylation domain-containing protein [Desulfuromonadaceae bacterium]|nr:prepilin-type N-terminal cleavage/methylation domain-containing protein [Desulfuromonadaceae bacterium]